MSKSRHTLLRRQLRRMRLDVDELPPAFAEFVDVIDQAYESFESDRAMLERSLEISSTEIGEVNDRLQSIFATIPDLYLWVDAQGSITEVKLNKQTRCPFAGKIPILGDSLADMLPSDVSEIFYDNLFVSRALDEVGGFEYRTEVDHGDVDHGGYFAVRVIPAAHDQTLVIFQDVTSRKRQDALRMRQSKLDSVGILAGGIAHDFNNILTVIAGGVSVSLLDVQPDSETADILNDIEISVGRAQQLTQQLLTFSKGGSPVKESSSIGDLIRESVQFALRGSNVRSVVTIPDDLWPVLIDAGQINQVLNNLVINANQSMKTGGRLSVTAENIQETSQVQLTFVDEGKGIADEHLDQIFDPYFTTKSGGSGLGLASCHSIITKHGGSLNVKSRVGVGTTFVITLPRSVDPPVSKAAQHDSPIRGHGRVLVMDDETPIRDLASRMLRRLGYECVTAVDGHEAIELYRRELKRGNPFDGVIMDLTIPGGLGGKDALRIIQSFAPSVRAFASSGYSNDPVLSQFYLHGFVGILPKPYNIHQLGKAMESLVCRVSDEGT